jgi:putative restriction endonuclease
MRAWIAMAFGNKNNPYGDVPKTSYSYDDRVQNHKQVGVGDLLFVRGQGTFDGIGRIANIREGQTEKRFLKCPVCSSGRVHERVGMQPKYKCKDGHEFSQPSAIVRTVKTFKASFDGQWLDAGKAITVMELRPFELRDSKQLAIMPADTEGLARYVARRLPGVSTELMTWVGQTDEPIEDEEGDEAVDLTPVGADERKRTMRGIRLRRGQTGFRNNLIERYRGQCVVTGCSVLGVLEAAHIRPYRGPRDNNAANGLLLRSDLHTLFDLNRIAIHPDQLALVIHPSLQGSEYSAFAGKALFPTGLKPDNSCLRSRWKEFGGD